MAMSTASSSCREFAEETLGIFGGGAVDAACVGQCSSEMHQQLHHGRSLSVEHQLKQVQQSSSCFRFKAGGCVEKLILGALYHTCKMM